MDTKSIYKLLGKVYAINSGGCGVAALAVIRWAERNNQPIPAIVFLYDCFEEEEAEKNMSLIQNGHIKSAYTPSHIALLIGEEVLDSRLLSDYNPMDVYTVCHSGVTPEELLELINSGNWNDWFVRKDSIPVIEEMLSISLSDVVL
jgi:hypothetical protein